MTIKQEPYVYFYDINGDDLGTAQKAVAKEIQKVNSESVFMIRVNGIEPVHHNRMPNTDIINPTFVKVPKDIFENYITYLLSKKEGSYTLTKNAMRAKGLV